MIEYFIRKDISMKKIILTVAICILFSHGLFAENNESTTTPQDARYEIVQSQLIARNTFRLDRFTGNVAQLVSTNNDKMTWEEMIVRNLPKIERPTKARFQIFTSGLAARFTFLIDTETGNTWVLTQTFGNILIWDPF